MPIVARFTTRLGKVHFKRKSYIEVHGSTSLTMLTRLNSTLHSRVISNIAVLKKKKLCDSRRFYTPKEIYEPGKIDLF